MCQREQEEREAAHCLIWLFVRVDGVIRVPLFARRLAGTELPPTAHSSGDEAHKLVRSTKQ